MSQKQYDRMVAAFMKIRTRRAELKAEYEAEDKKLRDQLDKLQNAFLDVFNETGATSIKTDHGLAYRHTSTKGSIADTSAFFPWVLENGAIDMLQKRLTIREVMDYMEQNDGEPPPGVTIYREHDVRVRKS